MLGWVLNAASQECGLYMGFWKLISDVVWELDKVRISLFLVFFRIVNPSVIDIVIFLNTFVSDNCEVRSSSLLAWQFSKI